MATLKSAVQGMTPMVGLYVPNYQGSLKQGFGEAGTTMPKTRNKDGALLDLSKENFPDSDAGRHAYLIYLAECATFKAEQYKNRNDPKVRFQNMLEREQRKLAEMQQVMSDAAAGKINLADFLKKAKAKKVAPVVVK